jgi:hypothetical protein
MAVDDEGVGFGKGRIALLGGNGGFHTAVDGIVLELVGEVLGIGGNIDDGDDIDFILAEKPLVHDGLKYEAADPPETIDSYFHIVLLLGDESIVLYLIMH